jgi:16S rRNA (uracil1498-N3)-methyltransferase
MDDVFAETWFHAPGLALGRPAGLPADEAYHMQKVLRLRPGRRVIACDGAGRVFTCDTRALPAHGKNEATLELVPIEAHAPVPAPRLSLAVGLLKGKDLEEPVEGLCQLPIKAIHLLVTDHVQAFKGQDHTRLVERLRSKSLVALKQAKKPWLTAIGDPLSLRDWRTRNPDDTLILVHPGPDRLPSAAPATFTLLTGPEGGFSPDELAWLASQNCGNLGLGETRIRGTHAPLLACGKLMGLGWL